MDLTLRILFAVVILIHGLIHFMGVAKAFRPETIPNLSRHISKLEGFLWLITGISLLTVAVLYLLKNDSWSVLAVGSVLLSQSLVSLNWQDAKFATIINLLIFAVALPV